MLRTHAVGGTVVLCATVWTLVVGGLAVWRHGQFLSHRYDLGHMVQAVWSTTNGRVLEMTDALTGDQVTRLAIHFDPILLALVPVWWAYPRPEALLVAQAAALSAGLYPVVRLALKHTGSPLVAGLFGAWYLCSPWLVWNALNDFHGVTLAVPLLLYAIWFLDEDSPGRFTVVAVLALACGELLGLTVAALGVWYAFRPGRLRAGLLIAVAGVGWTALCLFVFIPALGDSRPNRYYERFESVGGSPRGLVSKLFTEPSAVLDAVTSTADLRYVILLLLPTALLVLGSAGLAAVALPQLAVNTLSDFWSTTQPMFQYTMPALAPLIAATVIGVRIFPARLRAWLAALALFSSVLVLAAFPPIPGADDFLFTARESKPRLEAMTTATRIIPAGAPLTATNRLAAHLSDRERVLLFPRRDDAEWVVVDARDPWLVVSGERYDERRFATLLRAMERDSGWLKVFERSDIRVYRRRD